MENTPTSSITVRGGASALMDYESSDVGSAVSSVINFVQSPIVQFVGRQARKRLRYDGPSVNDLVSNQPMGPFGRPLSQYAASPGLATIKRMRSFSRSKKYNRPYSKLIWLLKPRFTK